MKNKLLTYALILAVAAVWGYVIYRIIQATQSEDITPLNTKKRELKEENLSYYTIKDLDSLRLDYRDPIYYKEDSRNIATVQTNLNENSTYNEVPSDNYVESEPEIPIAYLGFIKNEKTKKNTAIIQVNDKQYMVAQHETIESIKILSIQEDYIRIKAAGKQKTIYK